MMMYTIHSEQHLKDICKKIVNVDHSIRFAGVINDNGRLVTGAAKENTQFYGDRHEREMLFMEAALRTRMLADFDASLGPMNFSIYHKKNVITMEFPIENATVYVSSEKEIDLNVVPFKIISLLKNNIEKVLESGIALNPSWIKNNAGWWAAGSIGDSDFIQGIQWLITNGIMKV